MASNRSSKLGKDAEKSPRRSFGLRSRNAESKENEENDQSGGSMSLDVLAQVASETLKNEPKSPKKGKKRLTLKSIGCINVLTLEEILGLTEKTVVNLFSEVKSNELSRTFTYVCQLMPKECSKEFSSFGNEVKARTEIKKHLYEHLNKLENADDKTKQNFLAEPVHVRRKRLMNSFMPPKPKSSKRPRSSLEPLEIGCKVIKVSDVKPALTAGTPYVCKQEPGEAEEDDNNEVNSIGFVPLPDKLKSNKVSSSKFMPGEAKSQTDGKQKSDDERKIEENEQFIIDLLSKTQPHHDHCYTTIFGPRQESEALSRLYMSDQDIADATRKHGNDLDYLSGHKQILFLDTKGHAVKNPTPILFLRHRSPDENVPMVSVEVIIPRDEDEGGLDMSDGVDLEAVSLSSGEKPYPPMPKSLLAKKGRLGFDIADIPPDGQEDEIEFLQKKKSVNPLCREGREGNLGWEPKLALKYIRELKGRKKDDHIPLVCKICQDKTFTAAATLMYHYRSHAGIKPFVCLICNTTFTRQHSLNYHMLIHNNQSRFTCKDCGRKFRHPSHFKEHLRRHTGETPFECMDCGQKFKTRNTYKRHLKTRHGKLLTASGIHQLTMEEFAKVRTKRYNIPRLPDIGYDMPELTFTKKKKRRDKDPNYPNLPEIGYEMPELTFTKLKQKIEASQNSPFVLLEKIKGIEEIKREIGIVSDDPELDKVLQALAGHDTSQIESEENEDQTNLTDNVDNPETALEDAGNMTEIKASEMNLSEMGASEINLSEIKNSESNMSEIKVSEINMSETEATGIKQIDENVNHVDKTLQNGEHVSEVNNTLVNNDHTEALVTN